MGSCTFKLRLLGMDKHRTCFRLEFTSMMQRSPLLRIPLYHQKALPVMHKHKWFGNWGYKRFAYRATMSQPMGKNNNITMVDREWMHETMSIGLRPWVMYRRVEHTPTYNRERVKVHTLRRRHFKSLENSMKGFMQFKVMGLLKQQATMVNKYGQASVNAAMGDRLEDVDAEKANRKYVAIRKRMSSPPPSHPVTKHIATMYQIHNDRWNMKSRQR